jgi:cytochrome subunit of sulfide dehydrogenase
MVTRARFLASASVAAAALGALCAPAHAQSAATYAHTGRDLAAACAICHGTNGASAGGMPRLAGQPAERLARDLRDFRAGTRPATIMHQIAKGLTDEQIDALGAFYARQEARP